MAQTTLEKGGTAPAVEVLEPNRFSHGEMHVASSQGNGKASRYPPRSSSGGPLIVATGMDDDESAGQLRSAIASVEFAIEVAAGWNGDTADLRFRKAELELSLANHLRGDTMGAEMHVRNALLMRWEPVCDWELRPG